MIDKLSVIITTHNRIKDLKVTINSLIDIGIAQQQIYIIDDASTDDTYDVIKNNFPQINIRRNDVNRGPIPNRNEMIKLCKSEFIFSLDDDANLIDGKDLEKAIQILASSPDYGIFTFPCIEQIAPPEKPAGTFKPSKKIGFMEGANIIKRSVFDRIGGFNESLIFFCEQDDYTLRCFKENIFIVSQEDLIVHHRIDKRLRDVNVKQELLNSNIKQFQRAVLGFSNNIYVRFKSYPFPFNYMYLVRNLLYGYKRYGFKNIKVLSQGLKRLFTLINNDKIDKKLSYKQFLNYYKLSKRNR